MLGVKRLVFFTVLSAKEGVGIQSELTGIARSGLIQLEHFSRHVKHRVLSHLIPFNISRDVYTLAWIDGRSCRVTVANVSAGSSSWRRAP